MYMHISMYILKIHVLASSACPGRSINSFLFFTFHTYNNTHTPSHNAHTHTINTHQNSTVTHTHTH